MKCAGHCRSLAGYRQQKAKAKAKAKASTGTFFSI
jgi:hypothetical protein